MALRLIGRRFGLWGRRFSISLWGSRSFEIELGIDQACALQEEIETTFLSLECHALYAKTSAYFFSLAAA